MNYLDNISQDLKNIIIGYYITINNNSVLIFNQILETLNIDLNKDFNLICKNIAPKYYDIILDEFEFININKYDFLYNIKLLKYIKNFKINNHSTEIIKLISNIYYKEKINYKFKELYKTIKNINSISRDNFNISWKSFYNGINKYFECKLIIDFDNHGKIFDNYKYNLDPHFIEYPKIIKFLFIIMILSNYFKFELQLSSINFKILHSLLLFNFSIYVKIRELISDNEYKRILSDAEVLNNIDMMSDSSNYCNRNSFLMDMEMINYIKMRANKN